MAKATEPVSSQVWFGSPPCSQNPARGPTLKHARCSVHTSVWLTQSLSLCPGSAFRTSPLAGKGGSGAGRLGAVWGLLGFCQGKGPWASTLC